MTLDEIAKKHGWTYHAKSVALPVTLAGTNKVVHPGSTHKDYVFSRDDAVFTFERRSGMVTIKIGKIDCFVHDLFTGSYSVGDPNSYHGVSTCTREQYAERVLSRFDRMKLINGAKRRVYERVESLKKDLEACESILHRINKLPAEWPS